MAERWRLVRAALGVVVLGVLAPGVVFGQPTVVRFGRPWGGDRVLVDAVVVVEGDPLERVEVLFDDVRWVMQNGKVVVDRRRPPG